MNSCQCRGKNQVLLFGTLWHCFSFQIYFYLFIFWLWWAARRLSLVAVSGG